MVKDYQMFVALLLNEKYIGWQIEDQDVVIEFTDGKIKFQGGFDKVDLIHALSTVK